MSLLQSLPVPRSRGSRRRAIASVVGVGSMALVIACGTGDEAPGGGAQTPTATPRTVDTAVPALSPTLEPTSTRAPEPTPLPTAEATASPAPDLTPEATASPAPEPTPTPILLPPPPPVDTSIHSVPLEDVVFDTFDGGATRLSEATPPLIERLRDAIRPIYQPRYEGPEGGRWLDPNDLVIGYAGETAAYAYPVKMLNFHELVNDVIDGVPLLISYCPLCASGVVYDRRLDGEVLLFGNTSALYQTDLVMFDHQTGSYWFQVAGEAIVGALTGKRLDPLPAATMTWQEWVDLYPDTRILSRNLGFDRTQNYTRDPFQGYDRAVDSLRFPFPVSTERIDSRLRPAEIVLSVRVGDKEKAFPLGLIGDAAVNDTVAGEPVVVFSREQGPIGSAFSRVVDGRTLTFRLEGDRITDVQTGTSWDRSGTAVEGELAGRQLELLPVRRAFWFSLSLAIPDIALYQP